MNTLALIATRKGLFKLTHEKQIEEVAFIGDPVSMILAHPDKPLWYAALDLGHFGVKLHRSEDSGATWTEVSTPSYPQVNRDEKQEGDSLKLIWSLEFADPNDLMKLWAGTVPGGLFYSDDSGQSWTLNKTLWQQKQTSEWFGGGFDEPGIHSICVDPRNHHEVKVAISCGGVWVTEDFGANWRAGAQGMRAEYMPPDKTFDINIQDPHRMVQCAHDPDKFWTQHHNGIFYSDDNCQSWHECKNVSPSGFGFAVAVHPNNANKAWFVPGVKDESRIPVNAKFIVNYTEDRGKTFSALDNGLPTEKCYDLVFRHGLDIDHNGEKLLLGSTTGNLWLSEDQGQNWQCISNHLPPIYAVRFLRCS
ncbi:exo-alpha-sialidase [Aliikangiella marina]|uniref:Exo-alpha-sialidase n=1 Tax=Aliikangiella marina TaxID=1712262 RepID=A0A545TEA7_9GAMM|nr:exo-alpha-sialidase [Aliikangiella marina]TQV75557.1 exo-alpha-sialidase [Aliikangiella marina]